MNDTDAQNKQQQPMFKLNRLMPHQVQKIDDYLTSIGEYGEVRLIVQNGQLRYINKLVSYMVSAGSTGKRKKPKDTE